MILISNQISGSDKLYTIIELSKVQQPEITAAIIQLETGYLKCHKCSFDQQKNMFGFYYKGRFIRFNKYADGVKYYQRWQARHWSRYHKKYPKKSYYDFLKWIGWCDKMNSYNRKLKIIQRQ